VSPRSWRARQSASFSANSASSADQPTRDTAALDGLHIAKEAGEAVGRIAGAADAHSVTRLNTNSVEVLPMRDDQLVAAGR
jgi:hypothetical protein